MIKTVEELKARIAVAEADLRSKYDGSGSKRWLTLCGGTGCLSSNSNEIKAEFERLIAENNMETHGKWDEFYAGLTDRMFPGDYPEWRELMLDRVRSTCLRDRNHPAVVMWSCGNESLSGPVILDMADEFRRLNAAAEPCMAHVYETYEVRAVQLL